MNKPLNIIIPMAGLGSRFHEAGYSFPKPLIDIKGRPMIEIVIRNLIPVSPHHFIFICQDEHYKKYDLYNIFKNSTKDNFSATTINGVTEGAACTVLTAAHYINNDNELLIANSDQFIQQNIEDFIDDARKKNTDGSIMTFHASHPKWSYARINKEGNVIETAEKKVISPYATVGIYYFKKGSDFFNAAQSMIHKNIRHNNEFYICPVYNELILKQKTIAHYPIQSNMMHGLGTPEDLGTFLQKLENGSIPMPTS